MKISFSRTLFDEAVNDLKRIHPFAFERIGYLTGKLENQNLVLNGWLSIKDDYYEESNEVGARVGRDGMIFIMKRAFQSKKIFFHTHLHAFQRSPVFSFIDELSLLEVTHSLTNLTGQCFHGGIVIGQSLSRIKFWTDKKCRQAEKRIIQYGISNKGKKLKK